MRWTILVWALLVALAAPAASGAAQSGPFWKESAERVSFGPAGLSAPRRAATADYFETTEFHRRGEGLDTAIKYRSPDQQVFATLYVYYPSIAHTGIQAIATDQAIRVNSRQPVKALGMAVAAAAGKPDVAITADYDGYLGNLFSKAAFIKAGRWMVKIRVSGPQARAAEVAAVMAALLDGLRFEGKPQPRPAAPLAVADACEGPVRGDAKLLADGEFGLAGALVATFDAAGVAETDRRKASEKPLLPRIGLDWCRREIAVGDESVTLIEARDPDGPGDGLGGKSVLFALYSDAGGMIEVVRQDRQYLLLNHGIAEATVLGTYDALPSPAQIRLLFVDPGEHGRVRARVKLTPDGNSEIEVTMPPKSGRS